MLRTPLIRLSSAEPIGHSGAFVAQTLESSLEDRVFTKSWTPVSVLEDSLRTGETDGDFVRHSSAQNRAFTKL
jgi:hypothetical protein